MTTRKFVPNGINQIINIAQHKKFIRKKYEEDFSKMIDEYDLSIFYKNNIPIGMVLYNDLDEKNMSKFFNKIKSNIYKGGNVGRGKNMVVQTWS